MPRHRSHEVLLQWSGEICSSAGVPANRNHEQRNTYWESNGQAGGIQSGYKVDNAKAAESCVEAPTQLIRHGEVLGTRFIGRAGGCARNSSRLYLKEKFGIRVARHFQ